MLETSRDLLFIVISFCVLVFTGFLVWVLYYLAMILKQTNEVVADVRRKLEAIDEILYAIKEKITLSAATISAVARGVTEILNYFKGKRHYQEEEEVASAQPTWKKRKSGKKK